MKATIYWTQNGTDNIKTAVARALHRKPTLSEISEFQLKVIGQIKKVANGELKSTKHGKVHVIVTHEADESRWGFTENADFVLLRRG
jgi:hypothetical protein